MPNQIYFLAAFAGISIGSFAIVPAAAQSDSRKVLEDALPTQGNPAPSTQLTTGTKNLGSVLGMEVRTNAERNVGKIADLLVDRAGQIEAAVVEFGGFLGVGTRKIAIEWSSLRLEMMGKRPVATIDITRDQLRAAPEYKPDQLVVVRKIAQPTELPEINLKEPAAQPPAPKKARAIKRKRRHHRSERD
jgi:hypothetical protein